ncbi:hypothetical protein [Thiofilum flexile]|uniref:hypothetical protein n=1 Tax=Thiofilum flexile TaxID=125627 RepID=UPI00037273CF|nr:hypothetical protein [Thiofilum flexile]
MHALTLNDLHPQYVLDTKGQQTAVIISLDKIKALLERLNELEAAQTWDEQIAADAEAGKLDSLLDEAQQDYDAGKLRFR